MKKSLFSTIILIILALPMKGQFSFGVIYGKTKAINNLESNIDQLNNFNGSISMESSKSPFGNRTLFERNINSQYGISAMYQKHRNFFTIELTGNTLGRSYFVLQDYGNGSGSGYGSITVSSGLARINFQYGREIWKSKNDKISIIPTIAVGFMPNSNKEGWSVNEDSSSPLRIIHYDNRGLNTQVTLGLSAKFYLNPRFDLMFSTTYTHGFSDRLRYRYVQDYPGHGTLMFDISNKARFYNANVTFLYKLKKAPKIANKSIGHGAFSFGIISGKTFSQNKIDDNFNTLPNVDGNISKFNKNKYLSNKNSGFQYGMMLNYQVKKHNFTLELTSNDAGASYGLNSKYKGTDSSFNRSLGFMRFRRVNLQYGYAVLESNSKRFSLIPSMGVAIMPYLNYFASTGEYTYETTGIYEYTSTNKYKRALNTSLVVGLTARVKLNQRFTLQGNATYTHGFSEQYRLSFQKSYGADGTLYFDVYNKGRFYNANLSLLYTFQKAKPLQKNDMMNLN